jgi:hypothetical protein
MKNCLIMGSGRSGTSMVGGILHDAGYYMGNHLYRPRNSNPKGFFESPVINRLNEAILSIYDRKIVPGFLRKAWKRTVYCPGIGQGWLYSIPADTQINRLTKRIKRGIQKAVSRRPFAYKDPRFCYTLPVWADFLDDSTVFICIFREPGVTVESTMKECRSVPYLKNLRIDEEKAFEVWINMYSHVLEKHCNTYDNFFFVHYDQVYGGSAIERLSHLLGAPLTGFFVDKQLKRTRADMSADVPPEARRIYSELCRLAGHTG